VGLKAASGAFIAALERSPCTRRFLCGIYTHRLFDFSCEAKSSPAFLYPTPPRI
jgi:hypothetical protein